MITTVRHTGIVVSNMREAHQFYVEWLQCGRVVFDGVVCNDYIDAVSGLKDVRLHIVMLELPDGTRVELLEYLSHPRPTQGMQESCAVGCSHVALQVDDIEVAYKRLSRQGVKFHTPPRVDPQGYAKVTYCRGPDNVILELVQVLKPGNTPYSK